MASQVSTPSSLHDDEDDASQGHLDSEIDVSEGEDNSSESESDIQRAYAELYSESFKTNKRNKALVLKITDLEEDLRKARERESPPPAPP